MAVIEAIAGRFVEFVGRHRVIALGLALMTLVAATYLPVWRAGFIWDDDMHVTANPCVVGPEGFADIWTSSHARIGPLVISSFWLEHRLWGLNPRPYHLVNVALHALNALLLWRVLMAMHVRGAWLGAALWALHPVQVETAAWITELKNTQSGLFFLITILFFLRWLDRSCHANLGTHRDYTISLICAFLAMASKSSTVVLPVLLGLCWWWKERTWRWRNAIWLVPFLFLSALSSALSVWTQKLEGGISEQWHRTIPERMIVAGKVVWFYLGKLAWPEPLMFIYPRWEVNATSVTQWLPLMALAALLAMAWWKRDCWRALFMMVACFVAALLPVLGIIDHFFLRYSFVGDHFQYLASMAPLACVAAGVAVASGKREGLVRLLLCGLGLLVMAALGARSWQYVHVFQSSAALWNDTLAKNPSSWMAWNNLGLESFSRGEFVLARQRYEKSLALFPGNSEAHNNLGRIAADEGRFDEAIAHCRRAIQLRSDNLDARLTLSRALFEKGDADGAIAEWRRTIELFPAAADARVSLAVAMMEKGQLEEAIEQCGRAVQSQPRNAAAHNTLGAALLRAGRLNEALAAYQRAVAIDDGLAAAHFNFAQALRLARRIEESVEHYEKAAALMPDTVSVLNNFAWILATCPDGKLRNPARARELAEHANSLIQGRDALVFRTLAAASAASGDFAGALQEVELGLFVARSNKDLEAENAITSDRELYKKSMKLVDESLTSMPGETR